MKSRERFPKDQYPFSDELCYWMESHPEFYRSLKLSNPGRFVFIPYMIISHLPDGHPRSNDQVLGMFYLDKGNLKKGKGALFKQDFVVNVQSQGKEFVSYTRTKPCGKFVQPINNFFQTYGSGGRYYHKGNAWPHDFADVDELPPELRDIASQFKTKYEQVRGVRKL
ncbi:MAG: hypothetical protein HYY02_09935 [Chloroflexi bacterium]|nr:hypothetical protein [Chloroflexota bacterium]